MYQSSHSRSIVLSLLRISSTISIRVGQKKENKDLLICLSIYLNDVEWQVGKNNEEIWSVGKRSVLQIASGRRAPKF